MLQVRWTSSLALSQERDATTKEVEQLERQRAVEAAAMRRQLGEQVETITLTLTPTQAPTRTPTPEPEIPNPNPKQMTPAIKP